MVVRISLSGDSEEVHRAEREAAVLGVVGRTAAPELLDFRATSRWFDAPVMCLQFLPGPSRDLHAVVAEHVEELAALVAWVHQRPLDTLVPVMGPTSTVPAYAAQRLHSILATLTWARNPLPGSLQRRLHSAADAVNASSSALQDSPAFGAQTGLSLLHGDIGPGNVLWGPKPRFIDWEYARLGDPADEIAYTFDQNALSATQRESFWTGYADGLSAPSEQADVAERVAWWEPLTLLGSTLWWAERWVRRSELESSGHQDAGVPRELAYYSAQVTTRLDRLEASLSS